MINLYQILDVAHAATNEEIRANYRRKAMEFHPDRNADNKWATEQFQKVTQAYTTLNDPEKRREYDVALQEFYGGTRPTNSQTPDWLSNVFNVGMNLAENWARNVADETVYASPDREVGDFAESLPLSIRKDKRSGIITLTMQISQEDQSDMLKLCTRHHLDSISEEIGSLVADRMVSYFERKWRTG